MRTITTSASAGTQNKDDAFIEVTPLSSGSGVEIELKEIKMPLFDQRVKDVVKDAVNQTGFTDVKVSITCLGAWDYVLRARTETALERGSDQ